MRVGRRVAAIVLAAGASRRFGANKLLAPVEGEPLVRRTVRNVLDAATGPVFVVIGRDADRVRSALEGLPVGFVENRDFEAGISTSIRAGVRAVLDSSVPAMLIALGDQPSVTPDLVRRLVATSGRTTRPIIAPHFSGVRGHPVVFDVRLAPELLAIRGDRGARDVVDRDPDRVEIVRFDTAPPPDVDMPEDLVAILGHLRGAACGGTCDAWGDAPAGS